MRLPYWLRSLGTRDPFPLVTFSSARVSCANLRSATAFLTPDGLANLPTGDASAVFSITKQLLVVEQEISLNSLLLVSCQSNLVARLSHHAGTNLIHPYRNPHSTIAEPEPDNVRGSISEV